MTSSFLSSFNILGLGNSVLWV